MITPTVHTNGTAGEDLLKGFLDCRRSITAAIHRLKYNYPHPRDYPEKYEIARTIYDEYLRILGDIETSFERLAEDTAENAGY